MNKETSNSAKDQRLPGPQNRDQHSSIIDSLGLTQPAHLYVEDEQSLSTSFRSEVQSISKLERRGVHMIFPQKKETMNTPLLEGNPPQEYPSIDPIPILSPSPIRCVFLFCFFSPI